MIGGPILGGFGEQTRDVYDDALVTSDVGPPARIDGSADGDDSASIDAAPTSSKAITMKRRQIAAWTQPKERQRSTCGHIGLATADRLLQQRAGDPGVDREG